MKHAHAYVHTNVYTHIHVHAHKHTHKHTHTTICDLLNTTVGWFRLYRAIVNMQQVICMESDYYEGEYLKWNVKENSIGFYVS